MNKQHPILFFLIHALLATVPFTNAQAQQPTEKQLGQILKRFPQADADGDGKLSAEEIEVVRQRFRQFRQRNTRPAAAAPPTQAGDAQLTDKQASEFSKKIWASFDAKTLKPTEIFKVREGVEMHYFAPATPRVPGSNVAHLYIHGGGFRGGSPNGFYRWSRYLAEQGVSAFALKYRLLDREKRGKPTICVEDAKSAIRWLRANAKKLGIDPERIAVGGNSAGGHLAAALATIERYNHPSDDLSVKTTPNLLLLGSPALDTGEFFGTDISPMHNLNENLPNTLAIMGDSDPVIPMTSMEVFGQGVVDAGSEFEWWIFPGLGHGLNAQNESYLTPKLMHIYYSYLNFLAKNDYVDEPLPAGKEVRTMIRKHKLGEKIKALAEPTKRNE